MSYCVFESTNMRSTHAGGRIYDAVADFDIENGTVGYLDDLADGETHIYNFVKGVATGKSVVVVDQPAWDYDTSRITNQDKDKFIVKAGTPFRVRKIYNDDKFTVSIEGFTNASEENVKIGAVVTVDTTTGKFVASETATGDDASFVGKIIYTRLQGATLNNLGKSRMMYTVEVTSLV